MDKTLERILDLIQKKDNGDFLHGAKKEFCERIGAPTNIVNEWVRGTSKSYRNYLFQISAFYNVSVEWLKGESDEKEKATAQKSDGLTDLQREALSLIPKISDEDLTLLISALRIASERKG